MISNGPDNPEMDRVLTVLKSSLKKRILLVAASTIYSRPAVSL